MTLPKLKEIIAVAPSCLDGNKFFLFRQNGVEVTVEVENNQAYADKPMTKAEWRYFDKNVKGHFKPDTLEHPYTPPIPQPQTITQRFQSKMNAPYKRIT